MKIGGAVATLAVLGYLAFEVYAVKRNAYRMEAPFILSRFVTAARGAELCGAPQPQKVEQFTIRFDRVQNRTRRHLQKENPQLSDERIESLLQALIDESRASATHTVESLGCEHADSRILLRRFNNLSR